MTAAAPTDRHILVTGGAGFIGSHLVDALHHDNTVTVYDSLARGDADRCPPDVELIEADVRDEDRLEPAVREADLVFHQAAMVSVERSVESPVTSHGTNVGGTLAILEAARRADARVVLASSAALYGMPVELPIDENHPTRPTSPYGLEKLAADHYARLYHELYGVETVSLRYFNAYGSRQTADDYAGVIAAFRSQAADGGPLVVEGDGTHTRDFVHVSDVVDANLRAATADDALGASINIGTGHETSIRELAETVADLAPGDIDIRHTNPRPGDIPRSVADISTARELLGFEPTVNLAAGLETFLFPDG